MNWRKTLAEPRLVDALTIVLAVASAVVLGLALVGQAPPKVLTAPKPVTPISGHSFSVSVKTTDRNDGGVEQTPVQEASVRVLHYRDDHRFEEAGRGKAGSDGRVTLRGLPSGAAWILVDSPGLERRAVAIKLGTLQETQISLAKAFRLSITVRDDQDEPIEHATVLVHTQDPLPFGSLSDSTGVATFGRLGPPPYRVEVFARGFQSTARADVSSDQKVMLRRLGGIQVSVVDTDGSPAAAAEVLVVGSSLWPPRRANTDARGGVRLGGLFPGLYDLKARLDDRVSDLMSGFRLSRGQTRQVTLQLRPGRFVDVLVVDSANEPKFPVPEAELVLTELGVSSFPISSKSGKNGKARIGPLSQTPAYLTARAKGFVERTAVPIPAAVGEVLEVALLRGGTVRGLVTDTGGRPIDGARVEIVGVNVDGLPVAESPLLAGYRDAHFEWSMRPLPLMPSGDLGVTLGPVPLVSSVLQRGSSEDWTKLREDYRPWITGYDGRFVARAVSPGRLRALVRHPEFVEGVSESFTLSPGGTAEVTLVLSQGSRLVGRVVDPSGRPVPRARVRINALRGTLVRVLLARSDGTFEVSALPREISIALARPEEPTRFVARKVLLLEPDQRREVELVLPKAREPIRWSVVGERDEPIELVQVTLASVDPGVPLRATRFSDEFGRVTIDDAAGLSVRVTARAPGFVGFSQQLTAAPEEQTIRLKRGVWVQGKVTAVRGRREVAGARVTLSSGSFRDSTTTNERGVFDFREVPEGSARIAVTHSEHARRSAEIAIEATGLEERAFEVSPIDLPEAATLIGRVVDSRGRSVSGARLALDFIPAFALQGRGSEETVISDGQGEFRLGGLEPGSHTLFAYSSTGGRGLLPLELSEGETLRDVLLQLDGAIEEDPIGEFAAGVAVTLGERDEEDGPRVVVVHVAPGSEAARDGLLAGDVLQKIDGATPTDMRDARARLGGQLGVDVVVQVQRDGNVLAFRVRRERLSR